MIRAALIGALAIVGAPPFAPLPPVIVRDAGPGPTGRYLAVILAKPETRVLMADSVAITRDSVFPGAVVVISQRVTVSAEIKGDLIVVGGDLFIKPGAQIIGQAIAIGGAVYPSLLGSVRDGATSFRDFTFDALRVNDVVELRYRELAITEPPSTVQWPGIYGMRMVKYDRSRGLSVPFGPTLLFGGGRMTLEPLASYRSQIGVVDPSVRIEWRTGRKFAIRAFAARESRSNDAWITGDISNSINSLLLGRDTRNWYRADRVEATANRMFETPTMTVTYRLGGQLERASSAGPDSFPTGGPWSFRGRKSAEGMRRGNPQIVGGDIGSVLGGATYAWTATDVKSRLDVGFEVPTSTPTGTHFVQVTIDGEVAFPTFGLQRYRLDAHAILTRGDTAAAQRFGYLGGAGTLGTIEPLLSIGGDELLFLESRYIIPIPAVKVPFVGSPTVTLRHILGAAGIQRVPTLTQLVGVRLSVTLLRADVVTDPAAHKTEVHLGLSLVR